MVFEKVIELFTLKKSVLFWFIVRGGRLPNGVDAEL
jgi:hypothetical protein